jgi:hypothetical protein
MLLEFFLNNNPDTRTLDINQKLLDSKVKQLSAKDKMQKIVDKQRKYSNDNL